MTSFHSLTPEDGARHGRRRLIALGAGLAALAAGVAVCVLPGAAFADSAPVAAPAPSTSSTVSTTDNCTDDPAPGYAACFAEHITGPSAAVKNATSAATGSATADAAATDTPAGYDPATLRDVYGFPSGSAGAGQRVYVVDAFDDPTAESDLAVYRARYGLPACTTANGCFAKVNQNGTTAPLPKENDDWAGEISLDVDMVSAICPKCAITLVEATNNSVNNLMAAAQRAGTMGAKFVSMSWGSRDMSNDAAFDSYYLNSTGTVYTASAGDSGYQGAAYPASSPLVTAVGGTSLTRTGGGWSQKVWHSATSGSLQGTGSGCSSYEAKPAWQSDISTATCDGRAETDVSVVADPNTGVAVYITTGGARGWSVYGGTSVGAPIVAAAYALAGPPAADAQPSSFPYAHKNALDDITSGSNGSCSVSRLCHAGTGWDGPTGLGVPDGIGAFLPPGVSPPASERSHTTATATKKAVHHHKRHKHHHHKHHHA